MKLIKTGLPFKRKTYRDGYYYYLDVKKKYFMVFDEGEKDLIYTLNLTFEDLLAKDWVVLTWEEITMTWRDVFSSLFEGKGIRRKCWKPGMVVRLSNSGEDTLLLHQPSGEKVPYSPQASDIYDDKENKYQFNWEVVE
jgi:hypothetical protein